MGKSEVAVFEFEAGPIRVLTREGEPWWVAKDVCSVLGIVNVSQAVNGNKAANAEGLDGDEWDVYSVDTPGGSQNMLCVNESGLYALIVKSRKPEAKRFRKWVTSEVLPAIRKTGSYSVAAAPTVASDPTEAMLLACLENHRAVKKFEARQITLEADIAEVNRKAEAALAVQHNRQDFLSIKGYATIHGFKLRPSAYSVLGKLAAKRSRQQGVEPPEIEDTAWGKVKIYKRSLLDDMAPEFRRRAQN